jgi:hypothetical protein
MAHSAIQQEPTGDPLSEVTRKERCTLLAVSAVGFGIANAGLVPARIDALGIEFDKADQRVILIMLATVVFYFLVGFTVYALDDLSEWLPRSSERRRSAEQLKAGLEGAHGVFSGESDKRNYLSARFCNIVKSVRAIFDFVIPVVVGICAVMSIVCKAATA